MGARIGAVTGFLLCELAALLAGVDPATALLRSLAGLAGGALAGAAIAGVLASVPDPAEGPAGGNPRTGEER